MLAALVFRRVRRDGQTRARHRLGNDSLPANRASGRHAPRPHTDAKRLTDGVLGAACGQLGDSCGHPEPPPRDADEALEVVRELTLVREAGMRGDLCQGEPRSRLRQVLGALDTASDNVLVRREPGGGLELPGEVVRITQPFRRTAGFGRIWSCVHCPERAEQDHKEGSR